MTKRTIIGNTAMGYPTEGGNTNTVYEYGTESHKYKLLAKDKLTAYATIYLHYRCNVNRMEIYSPEECQKDKWEDVSGQISEPLNKAFGGLNAFEQYLTSNIDEIKSCFQTIKQLA